MAKRTGSSPQHRFSRPPAVREGNFPQIGYYFRVKSFSCMDVSTRGQWMSISRESAAVELRFDVGAEFTDRSGLTTLAPNNPSQALERPEPLVRRVFTWAKTL